ncbi:hypothetical protein ANO14919_008320 [Xylariales sp. No.14919]|nr:hypothetical protein ANO14919_008320 [Xylariales sp. No.14919]
MGHQRIFDFDYKGATDQASVPTARDEYAYNRPPTRAWSRLQRGMHMEYKNGPLMGVWSGWLKWYIERSRDY